MRSAVLSLLWLGCAFGQQDNQAILERLDRLERQNQELMQEIRELRGELAASGRAPVQPAPSPPPAPAPTLAERMDVQEHRVEENAQAKVESGQRLPVKLSGVVLMNSFINTTATGGVEVPTSLPSTEGARTTGAMFRQSLLNFDFDGGQTFGGGKLSGSLSLDFFGGSNFVLNHLPRIRTASARIDWDTFSVQAGQLKPIISPREPTSLSQVAVSPLTGAGNPWLWIPQLSVEHRLNFGEGSVLRSQIGIVQSNEGATPVSAPFTVERVRPAVEGRFEFRHGRFELAPGFHFSTTHVAGASVPSNALSVDWLYSPWSKLQFTGMLFGGANLAGLGTLRQGFTVLGPGRAIAVRTRGGWGQLAYLPTQRLSFHLMYGQNDDHDSDLRFGGIGKNQNLAANIMYRLAQNFIVSFETARLRTSYINGPIRQNQHYDLALAYLF